MEENTDININAYDFDATVKMIKVAYSLDLLEHIHEYTDSLYERTKDILGKNDKKGDMCYTYFSRPLIYYYGYSLLMKGAAFKKSKNYTEAKETIRLYSDLSWFPGLNEKTLYYVEKFSFFAEANMLEIDLLSGNINAVEDYATFLKNNPSETLTGLTSILEAAATHGFDIEHLLTEMPKDPIEHFKMHNNPDSVDRSYFCTYLNQLIMYHIKRNEYVIAIDCNLRLLSVLEGYDNIKWYRRALGLFEILKDKATLEQLDDYRNIILKGVVTIEETVDRDVCKLIDL